MWITWTTVDQKCHVQGRMLTTNYLHETMKPCSHDLDLGTPHLVASVPVSDPRCSVNLLVRSHIQK
jgi:hypothetical protein